MILPFSVDPSIESVFFANADKDLAQELIIIASWEQRHYEVKGTLFRTYVLDNTTIEKSLDLKLLEKVSKKLGGGCECSWSDGTTSTAKFSTPTGVLNELIRLGYDQ